MSGGRRPWKNAASVPAAHRQTSLVAAGTTGTHSANCAVLGSFPRCRVRWSTFLNCSDKFQQFVVGRGRPCDHAAWFDSGYMLCVSLRMAFGRISHNFFVIGKTLDPEFDSRRFSPCEHGRSGSGRARRQLWQWHAFCWFCCCFCTSRCVSGRMPAGRHAHGEKCAQSMLRFSSFTRNFVHYFYEPLVLCSIFSSRHVAPGDFLEPSTTKSSSLSRAREVAGSPGVWTPRWPTTNWSQ